MSPAWKCRVLSGCQAWFRFDLYSPSTGGTLNIWVGGPQNGQVFPGYVAPINRMRALKAMECVAGLQAGYVGCL